jgi:hypothetical protein
MNLRAMLLATVMAASISIPAFAQVVAEVEGTLSGFATTETTDANGNPVPPHLTVFKTKVFFHANTKFSTPTKDNLTFEQIVTCNGGRFPGFLKNKNGAFVGGSAIVTGTSSGLGGILADTVFLEPAENVLLGSITNVPSPNDEGESSLEIEGTPIVVIGKKRGEQFPPVPAGQAEIFSACFPGKGVKNQVFVDIPPENLDPTAETAAEGWFGTDGKFYAFLVEGAGSATTQPHAVSIARAQCRNRGGARGLEWTILGGVGAPVNASGSVSFGRQIPANTPSGVRYQDYGISTPIVLEPDAKYGSYDLDVDVVGTDAAAGCPDTVFVRYVPTGGLPDGEKFVQARSGVDAR